MNIGTKNSTKVFLLGDDKRVVSELVSQSAERFGDQIALTDGNQEFTYAQLPILSISIAMRLQKIGVKRGDRVMVVADNRIEIILLLLACSWVGAILVPINPQAKVTQMKYFIEKTEPILIFTESKVEGLWANWNSPFFNKIVVHNLDSDLFEGLEDLELIAKFKSDISIKAADTLAILFTSGTTGNPKGVMCPNGQFITWGETVGGFLEITPENVVYTCLPLFHTNALNAFIQSIMHGGIYFLGERFSVSKFWQRMEDSKTDVTYLLGAMVSMLLNSPEKPSDINNNVRVILAPGTPIPAFLEFERRFGVRLIEAHGMTETNAAIGPDFALQELGHMGRIVPGFEARIVDFDGNDCADGVPGELILRTSIPHAFASGYWRGPDETAQAIRDGWFYSGDRVVRNNGWYKFLDRIKDIIRRRGENISAREVEIALESLPSIKSAAVVAVPSELGEDEVMAFIVRKDGAKEKPEEILNSCSDLLPYFALPRYIEFVSELPLTENAKIRKVELRERGVQVSTWDSQKAGYIAKR